MDAEPEFFTPVPSKIDARDALTDLSSLNAEPAGAHGFVRASLGHFVDDRASRLRFFGVNLSGVACLPDRETAPRLARHFRKLGINAVRFRDLDAPGVLLAPDGQLVPAALAQLDHFTAALKAEGIYFSLVLHASNGYANLSVEAQQRFPQGKVLDRFHPPLLEAQREFARALLSHRNVETLLEYRAEPALLYVELSHEDTIFPSSVGNPDDVPAEFRAELEKGYTPWIAQRTAEGLRAPGPADEEAKAELPTFQGSPSARADYAQYLRELERTNVLSLSHFVRGELGLRSMLLNTQASFGGLAGVLREAELSDFIDMHGYWSDRKQSQINSPDLGSLGRLASYRVFGKPFVVSEFASAEGQGFSTSRYPAEMWPLMIGIAGLQDWDALFAFAYADQKRDYEPSHINGAFDLAGHPVKLAFLSTAAAAFRRGLVGPGSTRLELSVPEQPSALPYTEDALPVLWGSHGVPSSLVAVHQLGITIRPGSGDVTAGHAPKGSNLLGSDTGELLWKPQGDHARFSIDTPALAAVCGFLANSVLDFHDTSFEFHTFAPGFACASLISLDGTPIRSARRLLFTVAGRAINDTWPNTKPPVEVARAQIVSATVTLPRDAWRAVALDASHAPGHPITVENATVSKITTDHQDPALSYAFTR
ncbi:MAG TPA: hypothetical protein VER96_15035 [Polyangiaceae bacterium]|nr:hypothetical protein [Polyangiaceae bacterium]